MLWFINLEELLGHGCSTVAEHITHSYTPTGDKNTCACVVTAVSEALVCALTCCACVQLLAHYRYISSAGEGECRQLSSVMRDDSIMTSSVTGSDDHGSAWSHGLTADRGVVFNARRLSQQSRNICDINWVVFLLCHKNFKMITKWGLSLLTFTVIKDLEFTHVNLINVPQSWKLCVVQRSVCNDVRLS